MPKMTLLIEYAYYSRLFPEWAMVDHVIMHMHHPTQVNCEHLDPLADFFRKINLAVAKIRLIFGLSEFMRTQ